MPALGLTAPAGGARGHKRLRVTDLTGLERGCVYLAVFLAPVATLRFGGLLFTASDLLICLSLFFLLIGGRLNLFPLGRATPFWLFAFALLLVGLLGSSVHGSPMRALVIIAQYFFAYVVLLYALVRDDDREVLRLAGLFLAGMIFADLYGLVAFYLVGYQEGSTMVSGSKRLAGFFGTGNQNAAMNALTLPILLYFWLSGRLSPFLAIPALAVIAVTQVHTGSNSGLIITCVSLAVFLAGVMSWRVLWRLLLLLAATVLLLQVIGTEWLPIAFQKRVLGALSSGDLSQAGTFDHRLALMREAADVIIDRGIVLLGIGADQYRIFSRYEVPVHNMYLLLWVEGGLLALLGWLLFAATVLMLAPVARRIGLDQHSGAAAMAITISFLFIGLSNPHMYARYWTIPLFLGLGLIMASMRRRRAAPPEVPEAGRPVSWGATAAVVLLLGVLAAPDGKAAEPDPADARATLRRASEFMRERAMAQGSYGWWYTADLAERGGEGRMTSTQGWVQPPGMSTVGTTFLQAYEATGDAYYLDSAREVGRMLLRTQLRSGGWWYLAEFDPAARRSWCYRLEPDCRDGDAARENDFRNATTFDDDTTQAALAFLMRLDRALPGPDPELRDGIDYGLGKLLKAQYANGAWPFRLDKRSSAKVEPDRRAHYPDDWSRTYVPIRDRLFYSTNDYLMRNTIRLFLLAHKVYGKPAYLKAAQRGGEFLLAAQLPQPQPGWAQQYNADMEPIWGRKFEPPAVASRESAGNVDALLDLYVYTGEETWLEAAKLAVEWLERSRLSDGEWARFYELKTNAPLFMNSDYQLTYSDIDTPRHYGFKSSLGIPEVLERFHQIVGAGQGHSPTDLRSASSLEAHRVALIPMVAESIATLDEEGRWVEGDRIYSETFVTRVRALADYLAASDGRPLITGIPALELAGARGRLTAAPVEPVTLR